MSELNLHKADYWRSLLQDPSVRVSNETDTFHRESVGTTGNNVDMVICCLSLVGCIAIIVPYIINRRSRKLRHSLILGLATSDLVTSITVIITTACLIGEINLVQHDAPCSFLGYILVSSIFSQHLWNLSIAIVTYMILVHPLSSFTLTVERRVRWLWPGFWLVSFVINAIPFGVGGFGFRGGYCALTTSFLFSAIFQFVPRAIVFIVILCLYTHLFFFLRRTNLFSKANNSSSISHSRRRSHAQQGAQSKQYGLDTIQPSQQPNDLPLLTSAAGADAAEQGSSPTIKGLSGSSSAAANSRKTSSASRISPPVLNKHDYNAASARRRSSSFVDKDGSVDAASRRNGSDPDALDSKADPGLSSMFNNYSMGQDASATTAPLASYGLLDPNYSMAPHRAAPSDLDIEKANASRDDAGSLSQHSPSDSSYTAGNGPSSISNRGSSAPLNGSFARGSGDSSKVSPTTSKRPFTAGASSTGNDANSISTARLRDERRASAGDPRYVAGDTDDEDEDDLEFQSMRPRKYAGDFEMISPPVEHLKHSRAPPTAARKYPRMADILAMDEGDMTRARQGGGGEFASERRGSAVQILPGEVMVDMPSKEAFEQSLGDDWKWGMNVTAGGSGRHHSSHKLARNWRGARHSSGSVHPNGGARDDTGVNTGTSSSSSADENGVDSIGSTLNRQASLLLLLYPAAYCILFSFSIARLAVDLADPALSVRRAHDWLHSLSRWTIFAQGAIDAIIFQFIERQFRQRMKRRRRKAMGENVESFTQKMGKKAVGQLKKGWQTRSKGQGGSVDDGLPAVTREK
ncbi:G protein-coupled receptor, rhodopsin-like protein [Kalmanozyma brasiliensis GHG001]|uniref:G-protein coupled receptor-Carbon and cAMP sensor protein n=1 Tax=Kalmanozyma brasiliensis (strain GHG001) TaxID=1365824 RepID=V5EFX2_KALBG|nr:G protein-coupled receptor, rhodopsin-like protein [Kalmanozyma brasiliensis GHG001]EST09441.1 G protein-coupled receptor, rhodopsin-like protein [Kalmanozyma brasiliensis GHG001]